MNTASNWPIGSSLAQLNLELKNGPFPISQSATKKQSNNLESKLVFDPSANAANLAAVTNIDNTTSLQLNASMLAKSILPEQPIGWMPSR